MRHVQMLKTGTAITAAILLATVNSSLAFAQNANTRSLLHKGDVVVVSYVWSPVTAPGGGGSWVQTTGTVGDVTDTMFELTDSKNQVHYIPYTGVSDIAVTKAAAK